MTVAVESDEVTPEQTARMLGPSCAISLVQVGALHVERHMGLGQDQALRLLQHKVVPLLVWQLGSLQSQGQDKAASQVARALVAVAGGGATFQNEVAEEGGVEMLLATVEWEQSLDTGTVAAAALGNLSANNSAIKERIREAGGVISLLALMRRALDDQDRFALGTVSIALQNIISGNPHNKAEVVLNDGAMPAVAALRTCLKSLESLLAVIAFINNLSNDYDAARRAVREAGGISLLVDVLKERLGINHVLVRAATKCLWTLMVQDPRNQAELIEKGGIPIVLKFIESAEYASEVHTNSLGIICSMAGTHEVAADLTETGALASLIQPLAVIPSNQKTTSMIMDAVMQMAAPEADPMRDYLLLSGAITAMLKILKDRGQDDPLTPGILDALGDMLNGHIDCQVAFCNAGGVTQIAEFLMLVFRPSGCTHGIVSRVVNIMYHLSCSLEGAVYLRNTSAKLLVRSIMLGPHNPGWPLEACVVTAVATLGQMAVHSEEIRHHLIDELAVSSCIRVLRADIDTETENACIMALSNLSEGPRGQQILREQGGMEFFCRVLQRGPESEAAMDSVLALGHMALGHKENQDSMREAGAVDVLVQALESVHGNYAQQDFEESALTALLNLVRDNPENQETVGRANGVKILGAILHDGMMTPGAKSAYGDTRLKSEGGVMSTLKSMKGGYLASHTGIAGAPGAPRWDESLGAEPGRQAGARDSLPPVRLTSPRPSAAERPPSASLQRSKSRLKSRRAMPEATGIILDSIGGLALESLSLVCGNKENDSVVRTTGVIPLFVQFLGTAQDIASKCMAANALAHLALHNVENQIMMAAAGAMDKLIETLDPRFSHMMDNETRKWVCITLSQLVCGADKNNQDQLGSSGVEAIVSVLRNIDDLEIRATAADALHNLAANEINRGLIASIGGVQTVLDALQAPHDHELVRLGLQTMQRLSVNDQVRAIASKNGASKVLLDLATRGVDKDGNGPISKVALETLTMLAQEEAFKLAASRDGAIVELIKMMRLPMHGEVTCAATLSLVDLVMSSQQNRRDFRKCLGTRPLSKLLLAGPDAPVTKAASTLVLRLAVEKENKDVLRNASALDRLLPLLKAGPEAPVATFAARAVQGICDSHYMNQNCARDLGIVEETTRLLGSGHDHVDLVAAAAGALSSLGNSGNATNIQMARDLGAIQILMDFVKGGLGASEGSDIALCLATLTEIQPGGKHTGVDLVELVTPLVNLLKSDASAAASGQALNALASLAHGREPYKKAIVKAGAIPEMVRLLVDHANDPESIIAKCGARLMDQLASDEEHVNKRIIRDAGGLSPMVQLLRQSDDRGLCLAAASAIGYICYGEPATASYLVRGHGITSLCRLIRPDWDIVVNGAAMWALRIASAAPSTVLDLIASEQGIKNAVRVLANKYSVDTQTSAAYLLSQFSMVVKHHDEIYDRKAVEAVLALLKFTPIKGHKELKTYLVRVLCGLAFEPEGREAVRRVGGIGTIIDVLDKDCIQENGLNADISILTTELLWQLSRDKINALRMRDGKLIPLLVKVAQMDPNNVVCFQALKNLATIAQNDTCLQDVIDAGGADCFIRLSTAHISAQHKVTLTATQAIKTLIRDARHRQLMFAKGVQKALAKVIQGPDLEAGVEALSLMRTLIKGDKRAAEELVKVDGIQAIKFLLETKPHTTQLVAISQDLLRIMKDSGWEGKRVLIQTGAEKFLELNPLEVETSPTKTQRRLMKMPSRMYNPSFKVREGPFS